MKIEIDLDDDFLAKRAQTAVAHHVGISKDPYGRLTYSGDFARSLEAAMAERIKAQLATVDFGAVIAAAVEKLAQPTIEDAVEAELRAMAKKAAKAALKEPAA